VPIPVCKRDYRHWTGEQDRAIQAGQIGAYAEVMAGPEEARGLYKQLADRVDERLFGVRDPLRLVMVGILTGSHVLIDDVPGVGKTTLVRMLASLLGLSFRRVQFTPDLMPTDITGTSVLDLRTNEFEFRPGPIFTQVLLADEINRATPKTQAALLEAMQEHQVTVDGATHPLPEPFFVLATQNPIELEGTFPLPEAQLDRFLLRVQLGYPTDRDEERILMTKPSERTLPTEALTAAEPLRDLRDLIAAIGLEQPVRRYIVELARATRDHPELSVGASPRAVEQMGDASRAFALLDGRDYVLPDDVKALAEPVFGHRLVPTTDARIRDREVSEILREILRSVAVPTEFREG
jgi:MoxR-like ATPase